MRGLSEYSSDFNDLISEIYATTDDFSLWNSVLLKINAPLRVESSTLFYGINKGCLDTKHHFSIGAPSFFSKAFNSYFGRVSPTFNAISNGPVGKITTTRMVMSINEYHRTEFFTDFFKPNGFDEIIAAKIDQGRGREIILAIRGGIDRGMFEDNDVNLLGMLVPHIQRACRVHEKLGNLNGLNDTALVAMDHMARGAFLLDERGRVVHLNREARRIIDLQDGIGLTIEGLRCDANDADRQVKLLIRDALDPKLSVAPRTAFISRPSGRPAFVAWAVAANQSFLTREQAAVRTIIVLADPDRQGGRPAVLNHFGLTASEEAVAVGLASGLTAAELADARGVSINTIRSLRSRAYAKLGIDSQSALTRLIGTLPQN